MTVAPLIAMKSTKCESLEAVGKELDRRAHTYVNDVDQSGRHVGYLCRAGDESPVPLEQAIERRMGELNTKRKIRDNQVRAMGFIVSTNEALPDEETAKEFLDRSVQWFGARYGYENLLAAQIHLDEGTPHVHIWIAPVIHGEDGYDRLCAKELFAPDKRRKNAEGKWEVTAQGTMSRLQEDFWEQVAKPYGYERPMRHELRAKGYRSLDAYKVHVGTTRALKAEIEALEGDRDKAKHGAITAKRELDGLEQLSDEKRAQAAEIDCRIAEKMAELDRLNGEIGEKIELRNEVVDDLQRESARLESESARLESLRQGTRAAERDVEELRPIAAEVRRYEGAGRAERGAILDSIAARCAGAARAARAAIEELGDRIWALMRPRKAKTEQRSLDDVMREATEAARASEALSRGHVAPTNSRPRGQAR